ncbi:MAG: hypothetical protein WC356_07165, partial [Candidatus Micrarchaeia archaeon]
LIGEYTYKIENAILKYSVSTQVNEKAEEIPIQIITQVEEEKEDNSFLGLSALFGNIENIGVFVILIIAILVILSIGIYFFRNKENSDLNKAESEIVIEEDQIPIFDEINKKQIQGDEKTLFEEIKRREVKTEKKSKTNLKKENKKTKQKEVKSKRK